MATKLDEWKVLPRLMMLVTTIMYIRCLEWALSQPDLSVSQAGLISVVTGAFTVFIGICTAADSDMFNVLLFIFSFYHIYILVLLIF